MSTENQKSELEMLLARRYTWMSTGQVPTHLPNQLHFDLEDYIMALTKSKSKRKTNERLWKEFERLQILPCANMRDCQMESKVQVNQRDYSLCKANDSGWSGRLMKHLRQCMTDVHQLYQLLDDIPEERPEREDKDNDEDDVQEGTFEHTHAILPYGELWENVQAYITYFYQLKDEKFKYIEPLMQSPDFDPRCKFYILWGVLCILQNDQDSDAEKRDKLKSLPLLLVFQSVLYQDNQKSAIRDMVQDKWDLPKVQVPETKQDSKKGLMRRLAFPLFAFVFLLGVKSLQYDFRGETTQSTVKNDLVVDYVMDSLESIRNLPALASSLGQWERNNFEQLKTKVRNQYVETKEYAQEQLHQLQQQVLPYFKQVEPLLRDVQYLVRARLSALKEHHEQLSEMYHTLETRWVKELNKFIQRATDEPSIYFTTEKIRFALLFCFLQPFVLLYMRKQPVPEPKSDSTKHICCVCSLVIENQNYLRCDLGHAYHKECQKRAHIYLPDCSICDLQLSEKLARNANFQHIYDRDSMDALHRQIKQKEKELSHLKAQYLSKNSKNT